MLCKSKGADTLRLQVWPCEMNFPRPPRRCPTRGTPSTDWPRTECGPTTKQAQDSWMPRLNSIRPRSWTKSFNRQCHIHLCSTDDHRSAWKRARVEAYQWTVKIRCIPFIFQISNLQTEVVWLLHSSVASLQLAHTFRLWNRAEYNCSNPKDLPRATGSCSIALETSAVVSTTRHTRKYPDRLIFQTQIHFSLLSLKRTENWTQALACH